MVSVSECLVNFSQQRRTSLYDVARLHLTPPINIWQNSTQFFVQLSSMLLKWTILEDTLKNEDDIIMISNISLKTSKHRL